MKNSGSVVVVSDTTPLLADPTQDPNPSTIVRYESIGDDVEGYSSGSDEEAAPKKQDFSFGSVLALLLIGVFVANADASLVLATYGEISSEFKSLENASWLLTGYMLSMCGSQPLYGKLSNIYGRKALLLVAYILFATGCLICGLADNMSTVIVGRLISGAGGSGMSSVVSFLIADLVPVRDVATYRSYVNIVQTVGRSCGGPMGGWLAETMGWRWSFLIQCPLTVLAIVLVSWRLDVPRPVFKTVEGAETPTSMWKRIDILGATVMCSMIVAFLLPVSMGGNQFPWTHPLVSGLFGASALLAILFAYVELRVAKEPIFPLGLLVRRDVILPYMILFLQNVSQTVMMFVVPFYFQVTRSASPTAAGFYLIPAVIGNTLGGLAAGFYIKKHGRYRIPTMVGSFIAAQCHALTAARWTGDTNIMEAMYIFPGGLGTGIIHSSTFVAITAGTTEEELAIAGSGLYLCGSLGSLLGATLAASILRVVMALVARTKLPDRPDVIEKALSDVRFIDSLKGKLREAIVDSYVVASRVNFAIAFLACIVSVFIAMGIRERRLA